MFKCKVPTTLFTPLQSPKNKCSHSWRYSYQHYYTNKKQIYCHVIEWLQTEFEMIIGLTGHFNTQLVTKIYISLLHTHIHTRTHARTHTHTHTLVSPVTVFIKCSGNGFQWLTYPYLWIRELSPCLSHSSGAHNSLFTLHFSLLFFFPSKYSSEQSLQENLKAGIIKNWKLINFCISMGNKGINGNYIYTSYHFRNRSLIIQLIFHTKNTQIISDSDIKMRCFFPSSQYLSPAHSFTARPKVREIFGTSLWANRS
jgi:hypothetical protein